MDKTTGREIIGAEGQAQSLKRSGWIHLGRLMTEREGIDLTEGVGQMEYLLNKNDIVPRVTDVAPENYQKRATQRRLLWFQWPKLNDLIN